jgi:hypothetical protein
MSIDRVIAVRFPLHAIRLCTTGRAKRAVAITYTIVITLNLHVFFVYEKEGKGDLYFIYILVSLVGVINQHQWLTSMKDILHRA